MAGTVTETVTQETISQTGTPKFVKKVSYAFTADAADGSLPALSTTLKGWLIKAVTVPGGTAPTDNWDVALNDPDSSTLDALGGALGNRDTVTPEQVYPVLGATPAVPLFLCGTYSLAISGNSVNSATGTIIFYIVDSL